MKLASPHLDRSELLRPLRGDDLSMRQAERDCYRALQQRASALVVTSRGQIDAESAAMRAARDLGEMACTAGDGPTGPLRITRRLFSRPTLRDRLDGWLRRIWSWR